MLRPIEMKPFSEIVVLWKFENKMVFDEKSKDSEGS